MSSWPQAGENKRMGGKITPDERDRYTGGFFVENSDLNWQSHGKVVDKGQRPLQNAKLMSTILGAVPANYYKKEKKQREPVAPVGLIIGGFSFELVVCAMTFALMATSA